MSYRGRVLPVNPRGSLQDVIELLATAEDDIDTWPHVGHTIMTQQVQLSGVGVLIHTCIECVEHIVTLTISGKDGPACSVMVWNPSYPD